MGWMQSISTLDVMTQFVYIIEAMNEVFSTQLKQWMQFFLQWKDATDVIDNKKARLIFLHLAIDDRTDAHNVCIIFN